MCVCVRVCFGGGGGGGFRHNASLVGMVRITYNVYIDTVSGFYGFLFFSFF